MHHLLLRFSIKVTTFPKHRRSYRDKTTQPLKNHEVLSYTQNLNQKGTKSPRHFPNGNQTHPYILLCYGPTTQKKSWLKFVSLRGILLSSSLNSVKTPPGNTHKRTQKFSQGRAHPGGEHWLPPVCPSGWAMLGMWFPTSANGQGKGKRGRGCLLPVA